VLGGTTVLTFAVDAPFDLYKQITEESLVYSCVTFVLASCSFYLGTKLSWGRRKRNKFSSHALKITNQKLLLFTILLVYIAYVIGYDIQSLFYRQGYIDNSNNRNEVILILFFILSPFATVLIPFLQKKHYMYLVYMFCYLILFSSSSRFAVMVPFLFVVGSFLRNNTLGLRLIVFNAALAIFTFVFILQIRYYPIHGLLPNITSLLTHGIDVEYIYLGLNYVTSFSVFGVAYVLQNFTHNQVAFLISINPLPSGFLNVTYMLEVLEMKKSAPMSALSVLTLAGYPILCLYYFLSGYIYSKALRELEGKSLFYYIIVGLFMLFTLFSIQYNLRGLTRILYFTIFIYFISKFTIKVKL